MVSQIHQENQLKAQREKSFRVEKINQPDILTLQKWLYIVYQTQVSQV